VRDDRLFEHAEAPRDGERAGVVRMDEGDDLVERETVEADADGLASTLVA
jgi:hypothetical protein